MKEIVKDYISIFLSFLKDKRYIIPVIFVAILSYGFTITHYSIGVDDLCFDRYVQGTFILSAKRWGTWGLYNLLHITQFSPFWLDFIVATLMVVLAIIICTSIKRLVKEKYSIWIYVIFSIVFLSNPIIAQFFIYQSTNLAVVLTNTLATIAAVLVFETFFTLKDKKYYLLPGLILIFAISAYEACIQTYLVVLFMLLLLKAIDDELKLKEVIRITTIGLICLLIGVIGYYITGKIVLIFLKINGVLEEDFALHIIPWLEEGFWSLSFESKIRRFKECVLDRLNNYFPVILFGIVLIISIIISLKNSSKNKLIKILLILGIISSNLILVILQIEILYRTQFSWVISIAFLCTYIYIGVNKNKLLKYLISIIIIYIVVIQTNTLNNSFYNDYKRFEKEKYIANLIATEIKKCDNYSEKNIMYCVIGNVENIYKDYFDNHSYVMLWGTGAFNEYFVETTKFINSFGYNFNCASKKECIDILEDKQDFILSHINENIIELDNYIIVNLTLFLAE